MPKTKTETRLTDTTIMLRPQPRPDAIAKAVNQVIEADERFVSFLSVFAQWLPDQYPPCWSVRIWYKIRSESSARAACPQCDGPTTAHPDPSMDRVGYCPQCEEPVRYTGREQ